MFFVVIFSAFLGSSGRVRSVVGASVCAATIYRCGARHSHRCNLPDDIPSSLRSSCSFLRLIFLDPLSPSEQGVHAFIFLLEFFLAQKSSLDRAPRRGEGRVIELLGVWMTQWFRRQSTSFGIYAFSMHWCFTCFDSSDDIISVHNDVQVWLRLATFHFLCIFPTVDIHVCLSSLRHPSRRYVLHDSRMIFSGQKDGAHTLPHYYLSSCVGPI